MTAILYLIAFRCRETGVEGRTYFPMAKASAEKVLAYRARRHPETEYWLVPVEVQQEDRGPPIGDITSESAVESRASAHKRSQRRRDYRESEKRRG